jgi:hypothetical protein
MSLAARWRSRVAPWLPAIAVEPPANASERRKRLQSLGAHGGRPYGFVAETMDKARQAEPGGLRGEAPGAGCRLPAGSARRLARKSVSRVDGEGSRMRSGTGSAV